MLELNKIYNMDCIEWMKLIPDWSIDCVITDPPYWTTACKWDTIIPFDLMREQLKRIIKPNGAIVLFGSEPFSSALRMSNIKMYKYDWIWKKTKPTGFNHAKNMPMKDFENISVFSLWKINHPHITKNRMKYNPQWVFNCKRRIKRNNRWFEWSMERPSWINDYIWELSWFPKMVLEFNNVISNKTIHPTQKPVALIEYLIKTYSLENEVILDFAMWSWTTAIACINSNRNYIWFELDEWYYEIANKRIYNVCK